MVIINYQHRQMLHNNHIPIDFNNKYRARRQAGVPDVGNSFRMSKMTANGRTDLEPFNFAFNR